MRILITSIGTTTSINLIKYFKKLDQYIVGTDINDYGYTAGSILVDAYEKVPYAIAENFIETIKSIITKYNIDLFIPINDIEVDKVKYITNNLGCKCLIPKPEIIDLFKHKKNSANAIKALDIDVPEELTPSNNINCKKIIRDYNGVGSKGIKILEAGEPIINFDSNKQFIQKYVEGEEYTVDVLSDNNGKPLYIIPRKRLEVKSGVATKAKIEKNDILIEKVKDILSKYHLPGFANIQFIKDKNDHYWFIEVNYRFSGCGAATLISCKDYLKTYLEIVNNEVTNDELNHDVQWNNIVLRYYEEIIYNESIY